MKKLSLQVIYCIHPTICSLISVDQPIGIEQFKELMIPPLRRYGNHKNIENIQRSSNGESALYAILPSHMEERYFTSPFSSFLWLGKQCLAVCDGGGNWIIFWRSVQPEVWNPYPHLRIFLTQKIAKSTGFFLEIFANQDPFLRVFRLKNRWFYNCFANFVKWDPPLRIFFDQNGTMSKDFWWKSNPFGWHIPICLTCEYPPPPPRGMWCLLLPEFQVIVQ